MQIKKSKLRWRQADFWEASASWNWFLFVRSSKPLLNNNASWRYWTFSCYILQYAHSISHQEDSIHYPAFSVVLRHTDCANKERSFDKHMKACCFLIPQCLGCFQLDSSLPHLKDIKVGRRLLDAQKGCMNWKGRRALDVTAFHYIHSQSFTNGFDWYEMRWWLCKKRLQCFLMVFNVCRITVGRCTSHPHYIKQDSLWVCDPNKIQNWCRQ